MAKSNLDRALETLGILTHDELTELRSILDTLLTEGFLDPQAAKAARRRAKGTEGKGYIERRIIVKTLSDGVVKAYGPFLYLRLWKGGKLTNKYLGKASDATAEERERIAAVNKPVHSPSTAAQITHLAKFEDISDLWDKTARNWREPGYVYIGRGKRGTTLPRSPWGNPYPIKQIKADYGLDDEQARLKAIDLYRDWIQTQPDLLAQLPELQGKTLVCHCAPEPCHGDVLIDLLTAKSRAKKSSKQSGHDV